MIVYAVEGWASFVSGEGAFQVSFPTFPERRVDILEAPSLGRSFENISYLSQPTDVVTYAVGYVQIPRKWRIVGSKSLLNRALDLLAAKREEVQILERKMSSHGGDPAILFTLQRGEQKVEGKLVLVGTKIYQLAVAGPSDLENPLPSQDFFNSFSVLR